MAQEPTCRIPVVGYMEKGADGKYHLIPEKSEWADIPGSVIAEFLIEKFGREAIFGNAAPEGR